MHKVVAQTTRTYVLPSQDRLDLRWFDPLAALRNERRAEQGAIEEVDPRVVHPLR